MRPLVGKAPLAVGICLWLYLWIEGSNAVANIDTLEPIVRRSPARTSNRDLFGYSTVLHQTAIPEDGDFEDALSNTW